MECQHHNRIEECTISFSLLFSLAVSDFDVECFPAETDVIGAGKAGILEDSAYGGTHRIIEILVEPFSWPIFLVIDLFLVGTIKSSLKSFTQSSRLKIPVQLFHIGLMGVLRFVDALCHLDSCLA